MKSCLTCVVCRVWWLIHVFHLWLRNNLQCARDSGAHRNVSNNVCAVRALTLFLHLKLCIFASSSRYHPRGPPTSVHIWIRSASLFQADLFVEITPHLLHHRGQNHGFWPEGLKSHYLRMTENNFNSSTKGSLRRAAEIVIDSGPRWIGCPQFHEKIAVNGIDWLLLPTVVLSL